MSEYDDLLARGRGEPDGKAAARDMMTLVIKHSRRATPAAMAALEAGAMRSDAIRSRRVNLALRVALQDPDATFTPEDRGLLAGAVETVGSARTAFLSLRVTAADAAALAADANDAGLTVSDLMRRRIFGDGLPPTWQGRMGGGKK